MYIQMVIVMTIQMMAVMKIVLVVTTKRCMTPNQLGPDNGNPLFNVV
jgi:hypothetical protein